MFLRTNKALPCTAIQGVLIWWKQINPTIQVLCICFNKQQRFTKASVVFYRTRSARRPLRDQGLFRQLFRSLLDDQCHSHSEIDIAV